MSNASPSPAFMSEACTAALARHAGVPGDPLPILRDFAKLNRPIAPVEPAE